MAGMMADVAEDRTRRMFAERFEADGDGFLFRRNFRSAAVPVTAAERDRFIADYNRRARLLKWAMIGPTVLIIVGLVVAAVSLSINVSSWAIFAALVPILAGYTLGWRWVWNAPSRALRGRPTVGEGRSKAEARRMALERLTWRQLALAVGAFVVGFWRLSGRQNLLEGWNRLWLVMAALVLAAAAVAAVRKLIYARSKGGGG